MRAAGSSVESLLVDGEPVWESVDFDIACPRCGYNLRMLTRPPGMWAGFRMACGPGLRGSGLRSYLKLPRPLLLGWTAAGVAFLFTFTLIVFVNVVDR